MINNQFHKHSDSFHKISNPTRRGIASAVILLVGSFGSANAAIVGYNEVTGNFVPAWGGTGELVGGPLDGQNISDFTGADYFGAENGLMRIIDATGEDNHYSLNGTHSYFSATNSTTLSGGELNGLTLKNPNWLGATNNVNYYTDTDGVIRYSDFLTHVINFDATWDTWTNGELNGTAPSPAVGLRDFGGGNAMNENLFVIVDAAGTMEYYNLDNGFYSAGESEGAYGSWTTFNGGDLAGLTLAYLNANPTGVVGTTSYRFLGTADEGMYFDVTTVPEPSVTLFAGLATAFGFRRSRRR